MTEAPGAANLEPVLRLLEDGAATGQWRKAIITPAKQAAAFVPWEKMTAQPVRLSGGPAVKVVTRSGKKEATSTVSLERWPARLREALDAGPCHLDVLAPAFDFHARRTREGRWLVTRSRPSLREDTPVPPEPAPHDRPHQHPLPPDDPRALQLFIETGLYSKAGQPLGEAAAKFRQVQHYLELLRPLPIWRPDEAVRVIDAGCGRAYLSLALAVWAERQQSPVHLTGIDVAPEVIESTRAVASRLGLADARFETGSVSEVAGRFAGPLDLLVSLHACDTATDEALAAGVRLGARAIVLVPCCHQEVDDQLEAAAASGRASLAPAWAAVTRSGLLRHRLSDLVTDALRAAALEALGYRVDVIEFVSPEATARNLMLRASRLVRPRESSLRAAYQRYTALAAGWGVRPSLERLLGDAWPPAISEPKAPGRFSPAVPAGGTASG